MIEQPLSPSDKQPEDERYTHGYHEVIVASYTRRTAEVCAAFLLPACGRTWCCSIWDAVPAP